MNEDIYHILVHNSTHIIMYASLITMCRRFRGIMLVPSYLTSALPGSHLVTDSTGLPVYQEDVMVTFTVGETDHEYH